MDGDHKNATRVRTVIRTHDGGLPMENILRHRALKKQKKNAIRAKFLVQLQYIQMKKSNQTMEASLIYLHCMKLVGLSADLWAP